MSSSSKFFINLGWVSNLTLVRLFNSSRSEGKALGKLVNEGESHIRMIKGWLDDFSSPNALEQNNTTIKRKDINFKINTPLTYSVSTVTAPGPIDPPII